MNAVIRLATPDDVEALEGLMGSVYAAFGEAPPAAGRVARFFGAALARDGTLDVLVAEDSEGLQGVLTLAYAPTTLDLGRFAWLDDLHVLPRARGRRLAARLLEAARDQAARQGAREIRLSAERAPRLARLYREAGFRPSNLGLFTLALGRDEAGP